MQDHVKTPAYIIDERILETDLIQLRTIADQASCNLLYSPKACSLAGVLERAANYVTGYACSSLFELQMIGDNWGGRPQRHFVSPMVTGEAVREMGSRLDYLTVNSLSQWERLRSEVSDSTKVGLRINPQISFVRDPRYDPCKPNSKLGVAIDKLSVIAADRPAMLSGLSGLHFHTNCEESDFSSLFATARHVRDVISGLLSQMRWINMGGGYLFNEAKNFQDFFSAVSLFRDEFGLDVFIEPGAAAVRRAGTIEATVHDLIDGDDQQIAVLDTTVSHMSEVFEFQFEPDVLGHVDGGAHPYLLAGCTCLAGDQFGEYAFDTPLAVGSRVTFLNMGAYTATKAHRFNGVALPAIYFRRPDGSLNLVKEDTFADFVRYMGAQDNAIA